jgi:hypothetical protein
MTSGADARRTRAPVAIVAILVIALIGITAIITLFRGFYGGTDNPITERLEWTYQHEFVDREDLPGNLFAPEGYRQ